MEDLKKDHIDGLVQDCSNPSALAQELLQSCIKPPTREITRLSYAVQKSCKHIISE